MSYASSVKNELTNLEIDEYSFSELSALIKMNGSLTFYNGKMNIVFLTENASIARHVFKLIKHFFKVAPKITIAKNSKFNKHTYTLIITSGVNHVLDSLCIDFTEVKSLDERVDLSNDKNKRAYLRGAFLASGSVNNPQTAKYHFEIKCKDEMQCNLLQEITNHYDLHTKIIERNGIFVLYIKEAEKIVDCLGYMGAVNSLMFYENIRITRDMRNNTNRVANCEQANYEKSFNAARNQIDNIKLIDSEIGLKILDEKLQNLCKYRILYPEFSLSELADIMSDELDEPYTKSKLNHWFRKIAKTASMFKNNNE